MFFQLKSYVIKMYSSKIDSLKFQNLMFFFIFKLLYIMINFLSNSFKTSRRIIFSGVMIKIRAIRAQETNVQIDITESS